MRLSKLFPLILFFYGFSALAENIKLFWPAVEDAISYEIEVYTNIDLKTPLKTGQTKEPKFKFSGKPGKLYFRVRYRDQYERWSEFSNISTIQVLAKKVPPKIERPVPKIEIVKKNDVKSQEKPANELLKKAKILNQTVGVAPIFSTFSLKTENEVVKKNIYPLLFHIEKIHKDSIFRAELAYTLLSSDISPMDIGGSWSYRMFNRFFMKAGMGKYSLKTTTDEIKVNLGLYYYLLGFQYDKIISDHSKIILELSTKFGNPDTNSTYFGKIAFQYFPQWLREDMRLEFFSSMEHWHLEDETETLATDQLNFGIGITKGF